MTTQKQKRIAKELIDNTQRKKPDTAQAMVERVGYTRSAAKAKSKEIINSKGVKEAMIEYGFSEDKAKQVVGDILIKGKKEKNKLSAADMIFKVQGTYAPTKSIQLNIEKKIIDPEILESEQKYNELIKRKLIGRSETRKQAGS